MESSQGDMKARITTNDLQTHFGNRQLKDFGLLSQSGKIISIVEPTNGIPTVGKLVNKKYGEHKQKVQKSTKATILLKIVCMDSGYGDSALIGSHKYVLVLVNHHTSNSFVYGIKGSSGNNICNKARLNTGKNFV